jgi:hypothetical protein
MTATPAHAGMLSPSGCPIAEYEIDRLRLAVKDSFRMLGLRNTSWDLAEVCNLRCDRCELRADVNECIRSFPDANLSGVSGCDGHLRSSVAVGVGSSLRRRIAITQSAASPTHRAVIHLITDRRPFGKINEGFARMQRAEAARTVITR